jgi:hypothetical protein
VIRGPLEELECSEFVLGMEEIGSVFVDIPFWNYKINAEDLFSESASVYFNLPVRKQLML